MWRPNPALVALVARVALVAPLGFALRPPRGRVTRTALGLRV